MPSIFTTSTLFFLFLFSLISSSAQLSITSDTIYELGPGLSIPIGAANFTGSMNTHIDAQDMIITHRGYQYLVYYNDERKVVLGRRNLCLGSWEFMVFNDYIQNQDDRHNYVVIGICEGDGTIHLSFDHHVDTLNYRRSVKGLATHPENFTWDSNLFSSIRNYLIEGQPIPKLTYPTFIPAPNGDMNFTFRQGVSGNGDTYMAYYSSRTHKWEWVEKFISLSGTYTDPYFQVPSTNRNAYTFDLVYDDHAILHASWVWREKPNGTPYNHDIAYAWSLDFGKNWYNSAATKIGEVSANSTMHINVHSPGVNVFDIDSRYGMVNNGGQTLDHFGQPHLVVKHRSVPNDPNQSPTFSASGTTFHYWRENGFWHRQKLPFGGSRANIYSDDEGNLFVSFVSAADTGSNQVVRIIGAEKNNNWSNWQMLYVGNKNCRKNEPPADKTLFSNHGVLSVVSHQFDGTNSDGPMYVTDLKINRDYSSIFYLDPIEDSYVRADTFSDQNFGSDESLIVKNIANNAFDRKIYLKFDLNELNNISVTDIQRAVLIMDIKVGNNGYTTEAYDLFKIEDDSWSENTITWNNAPMNDSLILSAQGDSIRMFWNVLDEVKDEFNGDGILSLSIQKVHEGGNAIIHFFSKESHSSGLAPRLRIMADSSCYQQIKAEASTSIKEYDLAFSPIKLYPNPNSGNTFTIANLDAFMGKSLDIEVLDQMGRSVKHVNVGRLEKDFLEIGLESELARGIYFVQLISEGRKISLPLVLARQEK